MKHYLNIKIGLSVIVFMISALSVNPAFSQSNSNNPTQDPRYKDQNTSLILGIVIPGGGHFYSGENGTGAILLGTAVLAPVVSSVIAVNEVSDIDGGSSDKAIGALYIGLVFSAAAWIYSIVDSPKAAVRSNVKNGLAWYDNIRISPGLLTTNSNELGYGLTFSVKF